MSFFILNKTLRNDKFYGMHELPVHQNKGLLHTSSNNTFLYLVDSFHTELLILYNHILLVLVKSVTTSIDLLLT